MRRLLFCCAAVMLSAGSAWATTMLSRTTDELFHDSAIVGVARVIEVHAERSGGQIITHATLLLSEGIKGASSGTQVEVLVPGGVVGHWGQRVEGAPTVTEGESCVVFLSHTTGKWFRFTGLEQGKLSIETDVAHPGQSIVRRTATARLLTRGPDGAVRDASAVPETEPLQPYLAHLYQLGSTP